MQRETAFLPAHFLPTPKHRTPEETEEISEARLEQLVEAIFLHFLALEDALSPSLSLSVPRDEGAFKVDLQATHLSVKRGAGEDSAKCPISQLLSSFCF